MTPEQEAVIRVTVDALESFDVPYFITGSVAMLFHGNIRLSHDADIAFDESHVELPSRLQDHLGDSFYVSIPEGKLEQFNVIAGDIGYKVDFFPIGRSAFDRSQFARRVRGPLANRDAWFASLEDLMLSKLRWHAGSNSELQWRDLIGLISLHGDTLDRAYLERWADDLGLRTHLDRLLGEVLQ